MFYSRDFMCEPIAVVTLALENTLFTRRFRAFNEKGFSHWVSKSLVLRVSDSQSIWFSESLILKVVCPQSHRFMSSFRISDLGNQ